MNQPLGQLQNKHFSRGLFTCDSVEVRHPVNLSYGFVIFGNAFGETVVQQNTGTQAGRKPSSERRVIRKLSLAMNLRT
jgi:hypothetical protein